MQVTLNLDLDGDGIANNVDGNSTVSPTISQALTPSSRFSDQLLGGTTSGTVVSKGTGTVTISNATPKPANGVTVVVTGPPSDRARIKLDGKGGSFRLPPGTYILTDPDKSSTVEVDAGGPAEYDLPVLGANTVIVVNGKTTIKETTDASGAVVSTNVTPISGTTTLNGSPLPVGQALPTYDVCYLFQVAAAAHEGTPIPSGVKTDLTNAANGNSPLGIILHSCFRSGGPSTLLIAKVSVKQVNPTTRQYTLTLTANGNADVYL